MERGRGETSLLHLLVEKKKENSEERTEREQPCLPGTLQQQSQFQSFLCVLDNKEVNQKLQKRLKEEKQRIYLLVSRQFCLACSDSLGETLEQMHLAVHTIHRVYGWRLF